MRGEFTASISGEGLKKHEKLYHETGVEGVRNSKGGVRDKHE